MSFLKLRHRVSYSLKSGLTLDQSTTVELFQLHTTFKFVFPF